VCSRIIASHPDLIAVHGATVLKHGVAALICGRSGAGKSTLSLALAARGFQVGGDDVALLDPRERTIRPVPRCFHLDARSRRLLRNLGLVMPSRALRYRFMTPADLGVTSPPAAPVRLIIFLDRGTRREGRLRTLSQAEMMARLLSETPRGPHSPSQIMEALGPLVSGAACFQLTGGRLSDNAGTVVTLLSQA
jgi:energy-coupling factor transporter ATP-binding protein EcfA2